MDNREFVKGSNMNMVLKETYINNSYRVVIRTGSYLPFLIQTEQKATESSFPWEVNAEGWRACVTEFAGTPEEADRKYEQQIVSERRWH